MLSSRQKRNIPVILGTAVLLVLFTWAFHNGFTTRVPGANDFFSQYGGAYLYFKEGINPYSQQATEWIQLQLSGEVTTRGTITNDFVYPFYTILIVAPYILLPTYAWVQAAWQVTLIALIFLTLWIIVQYHGWRIKPWQFGLLSLWTLLFYPTFRALILGQMSVIVFFTTILTFWFLFRDSKGGQSRFQRDILAGFCIALSTIKPQMQFIIIPFLLLWALREQRWTFILSSAGSLLLLCAVSWVMLPSWLGDWVFRLREYTGYTPPGVSYIITTELLPLGSAAKPVEFIFLGLATLYMLYEWWRVIWLREHGRLDWVLGLTLVITHIVAPRTATTHYVVFMFPLVLLLKDWSRKNGWLVIGLMVLATAGLWWLFIATTVGEAEANIMFVPPPLILFLLLLLNQPQAPNDTELQTRVTTPE